MEKKLSLIKKIPASYKQTEVGVIPVDWDVKEMKDFTLSVASGKSNTTNELGDYPIYGSTGIIGYRKQPDYSGNKILIARVGANAGTVNEVNGKYCVSDNTLMVTYQSRIDINFSHYQLINFKLNKLTFGSGQPLVTGSQIKKITFALPKKKTEQTAIANVLSDTDALIEHLEKLIAKKKAIKQGTMQQLLTGKKRMPGFSGEWETNAFGGMIEINKGQQLNKSELTVSEEYPDWNGGISPSGYTNKWNMAENTITISEGGNSCGFVNYCKTKFWLGGHCYALKITNTDLDKAFLYQFLKFKEKSIMGLRIGSGLPNIQKKNLNEFKLFIPKDKREQVAIATVLSDMDAEIEKLEQKRDKYTMLKQGMMQQLLTGRIRIYASN